MKKHFSGDELRYDSVPDAQEELRSEFELLGQIGAQRALQGARYLREHYTSTAICKVGQPSALPQIEIVEQVQTNYAPDGLEYAAVSRSHYDLMLDLGLARRMREVQFGSRALYRYLLFDGMVQRGTVYNGYLLVDGEVLQVPDSDIRGFTMIPIDMPHRDTLLFSEVDMASVGTDDVARVRAAVEQFSKQ